MKKVFRSFDEVYHLWANRTQSEARSANSSFNGDWAYSYHTQVARLVDGAVIISAKNWSATTNKHLRSICNATRHLEQVFIEVAADLLGSKVSMEWEIAQLLSKAAVARTKRDGYIADALNLVKQFNRAAELLGDPRRIEVPVYDANTMLALAQVEKDKRAAALAREKERERIAALTNAELIAAWRAGGARDYRLSHSTVMLRIKDDAIETSHSARIPVDAAVRLYPLIQRVMRGDKDYEVGMELGKFRLTKIRTDGSIVVGCHDIPHAEIEMIAAQLRTLNTME